MNNEADFLAALAANPYDELLYQAFGDWLEEQGDPRAPWVRCHDVRPWMGPNFENPIPRMIDSLKQCKSVLDVRRAVVDVGTAIIPELVELLKHENAYVRLQAVFCLRQLGKTAAEAVPALVEMLKDPENKVREQAAKAIKACGARKVTDTATVRAALADDNYQVRQGAAGILKSLGAREQALEELVDELKSPKAAIRLSAVEGLAHLGTQEAIAPLCLALSDHAREVRRSAASWLPGLVGPKTLEAIEPLETALRDKDPELREKAAAALCQIGPSASSVIPELIRRLHDEEPAVRAWAVDALGKIGAGREDALDALTQMLGSSWASSSEVVVDQITRTISCWPRLPESLGPVLESASQRVQSTWCQWGIVAAIGKLERVSPALLKVLRQAIRTENGAAFETVENLGTQAKPVIPALVAAVRNRNIRAALALGHLGEEGLARLVELLSDSDEGVATTAAAGFQKVGEAALPVLPRMLTLLQNRQGEGSHRTIWCVCEVIQSIGPAAHEAIPTLLELLNSYRHELARVTLEALGEALIPSIPDFVAILRRKKQHRLHPRVTQLLLHLAQYTTDVLGPLRQAIRATSTPQSDNDIDHYHRMTREIAARALRSPSLREQAHQALPELLPLVRDPYEQVRREAVETIGQIGRGLTGGTPPFDKTVQGLRTATEDADDKVRALVMEALGRMGDTAAVPDLLGALRDRSARVRREAATALGRLKPDGQKPLAALRQAEQDEDKGVRREATSALKKLEGSSKRAK